MIYFYEFLKGVGFALFLFGALYFFMMNNFSLAHLCLGAMPGLFVLIIGILLVENYELQQKLS